VFFVIYVEPFLVCLEALMCGPFIGDYQRDLCRLLYLDDMNILSKDERNIVVANEVSRAFKEASGAIFSRNRKTVILGLGSWESRQA
jgi:hypothetical protein